METFLTMVGVLLMFMGVVTGVGAGTLERAFGLDAWLWRLVGGGMFVLGAPLFLMGLSLVMIAERQVGIVIKKFAGRNLPPGRLIALNGEAGYQAETLSPGWHFGECPAHRVQLAVGG